jgi:hypothetical protein
MKSLIILFLLFSTTAGAQNKLTEKEFDEILNQAQGITTRTLQPIHRRADTTLSISITTQWLLRGCRIYELLELYSRYEKEAMRDSVQTIEIIPYTSPMRYDTVYCDGKVRLVPNYWGTIDLIYHPPQYRTVWIHPNAPPPNPFIEWLRKQSN